MLNCYTQDKLLNGKKFLNIQTATVFIVLHTQHVFWEIVLHLQQSRLYPVGLDFRHHISWPVILYILCRLAIVETKNAAVLFQKG